MCIKKDPKSKSTALKIVVGIPDMKILIKPKSLFWIAIVVIITMKFIKL